MSVRRALGTLRPIIYFQNCKSERHPKGFVMLAPETHTPKQYTPEGFEVCEAGTLADVTKLQKKLELQEMAARDMDVAVYEIQYAKERKEKLEKFTAMLVDSETSNHDKKFIEAYLQVREDRREKYEKIFSQRTAYLNVLAYDEGKANQELIDKAMSQ